MLCLSENQFVTAEGKHIQAAGGVRCQVMSLAKDPAKHKVGATLVDVSDAVKAPQLSLGRWWWDAAE